MMIERSLHASRMQELGSLVSAGQARVAQANRAVQEAQAAYDLAVAQEIEAVNLVDQARESLREVTGQYHTQLALLGDELPLIKPEPADIDQWTETALRQNLDLAAALAGAETAQQEIARQRAGHWPSIDAYGNVGYDRTGGRFGQADTYSDQIGIQMNVPIYEGGQVVSRTREAEFRHQEALDRVEESRRAVQRLTRDAYNGVLTGISRVDALKQAVVSAQTALEATQAGFEVGTRTTVDVVAAERDLYSAKRDYARSRYDYILDQYRLREAAGTLSPEDLARMDVWLTRQEQPQP
jgi:outer membrane protein